VAHPNFEKCNLKHSRTSSQKIFRNNATEHPTAEWTLQQLREALPGDQEYKFLLHDRHKAFSTGLDEEVERWGIAMAAVHISPWGLAFQTKLSGRCRQTTTINQYPGTDGSSRSQYSAVCITSIDGLMPPDLLVTNASDYAYFSTLWNSCAAQRCAISQVRRGPAESKTPRMCRSSTRENRETQSSPQRRKAAGR
jgi:hypothetical protein